MSKNEITQLHIYCIIKYYSDFFSDEIWYFATKFEPANICKVNTKEVLARLRSPSRNADMVILPCSADRVVQSKPQLLPQTLPEPHWHIYSPHTHWGLTSLKTDRFHLCLLVLAPAGETQVKPINEVKEWNPDWTKGSQSLVRHRAGTHTHAYLPFQFCCILNFSCHVIPQPVILIPVLLSSWIWLYEWPLIHY